MRPRVQRREIAAELELLENVGCDKTALKEVGTAVDDAVSDRLDLAHVRKTSDFGIRQRIDDDLHGDGMVGHREIAHGFASVLFFMLDEPVDADSLADSFCEHLVRCGVHELIFERGAARIDYQYIHDLNDPPFIY